MSFGDSWLTGPMMMNMGFHYTEQYNRRRRIKVLGLVDQATDEWNRWYAETHEFKASKKMAEAGYDFIEIHFLYGYGFEGERPEIQLTKKMTANAHKAGLKVIGYFQFYSVQEELFFIENPWAADCCQYNSDGTRGEYEYDRPALCFSHEKVRDYYLDGVELGLRECGLDGIRLDNDYYKGCYCPECQRLFREYLKNKFTPERALKVFGFQDLSNITMPPVKRPFDPAWLELCLFRQKHRQNMMRLIKDRVKSVKPDAILGGNPALAREFDNDTCRGVYPYDLGETHDIVCVENSFFPGVTGNSFRTQAETYSFAECAGFKAYPSHHLYDDKNRVRWPDTAEECALSHFEALAFGGHIPCTTWGIRMDSDETETLYEREYFLKSTRSASDFMRDNEAVFRGFNSSAETGILVSRHSRVIDPENCALSLWGTIQILMKNKIPFRFVDSENTEILEKIKTLIVPDVRLLPEKTVSDIRRFARENNLIITGESARYDEFGLRRNLPPEKVFGDSPGIVSVAGTPEKINAEKSKYHFKFMKEVAYPEGADIFVNALNKACKTDFLLKGGEFTVINRASDGKKEAVHILNYDNTRKVDAELIYPDSFGNPELLNPSAFGCESFDKTRESVIIKGLGTYCCVVFDKKRITGKRSK